MTDQKKADRHEYMKAYYNANKERLAQKRKSQPRTPASIAAEQRYREKKKLLQEIEGMPHGPVFGIDK